MFKKGTSGNPAGRPKTPKHNSSALRDQIAAELPAIIASLIQQAQAGDVQAARTLLDKALPNVRPVSLATPLPALAAAQSLTEKADVILDSLASGDIGSDTAMTLMNTLGKAREISASNAGQPIDTEFNITISDAWADVVSRKHEADLIP